MYQNGAFAAGLPPDFLDASMDGLDMSMDLSMDLDLSLPNNLQTSTRNFTPIAPNLPQGLSNTSNLVAQSNLYTQSETDGMSNNQGGMTPTARMPQVTQPPIDPNEIGGGPLPAGFGLHAQQQGNTASQSGGTNSTLTDFTKRRNWSQRVLEELRDFLHILTPEGRILYCSPSTKALTGYDNVELVGRFIGDFIHPDDSGIYICEFNEAIASGNPLRFFYRFRKADSTYAIFEAHGHPHLSSEVNTFSNLITSGQGNIPNQGFCRGFFMMSRPYPTKNAGMLDSFLEHKIENERLVKRIAELRREETEENEAAERQWAKRDGAQEESTTGASETQQTSGVGIETVGSANQTTSTQNRGGSAGGPVTALTQEQQKAYREMPPPAKTTSSNIALTRQNLDEALAGARTDSINDKMARYEGLSSHYDSIEMLTGLRYRDGERSQGISTGDASPHLIRGDVGIAISGDRKSAEARMAGNGAKKVKVADEYVCTDCGTLDSPEWRKGPNGPKTLCNACGLRWAKKEKKRQSIGSMPVGLTPGGLSNQPASLQMHLSSGSG